MSIVKIFSAPVDIEIDCSYCGYAIEMSYSDFEDLMSSDYPGDWGGEKIECPECGEEIEIEGSDWE